MNDWQRWIDSQHYNVKDKWFIYGGNPDGNGGGIIATTNSLPEAANIRLAALKMDFSKVSIRTWDELHRYETQFCSQCGADTANPCGCVAD